MSTERQANQQEFVVEYPLLAAEAGEDLLNESAAKLIRFAQWLYGDEFESPDQIPVRYSQSIIARSESELLGVSSPRFAFRASLGERGFVNIRRRRKMFDAIESGPYKELASRIFGKRQRQETTNWIADCLLSTPARLGHFKILNCSFGSDYGEPDLQRVTPFVTHVDFGGGLCAQAACFMALGLADCDRILGIAEITSLAMMNAHSQIEGAFRVRGLSPSQIESFLREQETHGVTAQRQGYRVGKPNSVQRIATAMRIYLANKIPVIPLVSLRRMLGMVEDGEPSIEPIIRCGRGSVDPDDFTYLPIGHEPTLRQDNRLCHSVVLVGYSDTEFAINDPASFPFLKCTDQQLHDIRPNLSLVNDQGSDEGLTSESKSSIRYFQSISVTPPHVRLPLLQRNFIQLQNGGSRGPDGLLDLIERTFAKSSTFGVFATNLSVPGWMRGRIHLIRWNTVTQAFVSSRDRSSLSDENIVRRLGRLRTDVFWMHSVEVVDKNTGNQVDSLWFWDATARTSNFEPVVFVNGGHGYEERESEG